VRRYSVHRNECADAHGFINSPDEERSIEKALAALDDIPCARRRAASKSKKRSIRKTNLVVAKAARIAGDAQWLEIVPKLVTTFQRLLPGSVSADKGCSAKTAIARALNKLEYDGAELFVSGMKHRQPEGVWAGRKIPPLIFERYAQWDWPGQPISSIARNGQSSGRQGMASTSGSGARDRHGRRRCRVVAASFQGAHRRPRTRRCFRLLYRSAAVDGAAAVPLVASFAERRDDSREPAILALGESRREDAVEVLKELFGRTADPEGRLLRAHFPGNFTHRIGKGISA